MSTLKNPSGLLNLNKPSGISSRSALNHVTRLLRKVKVGHAGTLDPLASGVLVVCVGSATRLIESVQAMSKTYRVVIRLDATSDTLDADGEVLPFPSPVIPDLGQIEQALARQIGTIEQLPPAYSALKVNGVRAYSLARSGQTVVLNPRTVTIHQITILSFQWPRVELEIVCGGGTYIRSMARDLGDSLGCGGLVEVLVRTGIGPFTLDSAIEPTDLTAASLLSELRLSLEAVPDLPKIPLSMAQVAEVVLGKAVDISGLALDLSSAGNVALVDPLGELVAIGEVSPRGDRVQPRKVMITGETGLV